MISWAVFNGLAWIIPAARPANKGAEKDVPFKDPMPPDGSPVIVANPMAATSGLMRKSAEGPMELKEARSPVLSTAPTLKMESASAGAVMYFHESFP